jgi:hypothetical protein
MSREIAVEGQICFQRREKETARSEGDEEKRGEVWRGGGF